MEKKIRQNKRFEGEGDYRLHGETGRAGEKEGGGKGINFLWKHPLFP